MEAILTADKIIIVLAHEWGGIDVPDAIGHRNVDGYVQVICLSGIWYDILTNDEARHMWE